MHSIIIGCGRVGVGLAQRLCQHRQSVTVVDQETTAFERLGPGSQGRRSSGPDWTVRCSFRLVLSMRTAWPP